MPDSQGNGAVVPAAQSSILIFWTPIPKAFGKDVIAPDYVQS